MPHRNGYAHGTPGWIDLSSDDIDGSKAFYGELFGWRWENQQGPDGPFVYSIAHLGDRTVAGLGAAPSEMVEAGVRAAWNTYFVVDSVDTAHRAVLEAGGTSLFGPFDVMAAGRMAFIMDDQGVCSGLWQGRLHKGAQVVNEPGAFTWVELHVSDTEAAERFYGAALGLGTEPFAMEAEPGCEPMQYTLWKVGDDAVGGLMTLTMEGAPPQWHVYFGVADIDLTVAKVADLGGNICAGPFPTPAGSQAVIQDPCGGLFSALQVSDWPTE